MIKINKLHSDDLCERYLTFTLDTVIQPKLSVMIDAAPPELRANIRSFFNRNYLRSIILSPPEDIENIINTIYSRFPVFAERYCYSYLLANVFVDERYKTLNLMDPADKILFDSIVARTVRDLSALAGTTQLYITPDYLQKLSQGIARSEKKKHLMRLENAKRGRSQATDKIKSLFPVWVNEFEKCFDYEAISEEFGLEIAQSMDLNICPYCGLEYIQTYTGDDIFLRPDLDHFYPKTRFPFLATCLYNLIPSGVICNQKHKKNYPMLGHMHPCVDGLDNDDVFDFIYFPEGDILDTLEIGLRVDDSNHKGKNLHIFKIKPLYNKHEDLRVWFKTTYDVRNFFQEQGLLENPAHLQHDHVLLRPVIDLIRPITKVTAQKFKVEAVNNLFNTTFRTIPQQED